MREILFRGKDIYGKWLYGDLINLTENIKQICNHSQLEHAHSVNPETVGQYTGLTDKNGKKIFEGDIVKDIVGRMKAVEFYNGRYYPFISFPEYTCWNIDEVEVIGNIYDNPELLKGGEG